MSIPRIRIDRETLAGGQVEWARRETGSLRAESGVTQLGTAPALGECELVIASELVLLDRLQVPPAQRRKLGDALRFLAEDGAIPDPENLHVAAAVAPGSDSVAIAVVERQWLTQILARLARAGITARSAWPECLLAPLPPHTWTVVCGSRESYVRTGDVDGLILDRAQGGEAPVALGLALENARKAGSAPARIEVRPGPDATAPDTSGWSQQLGVQVEAAPAWRWSDSSETPRLDLLQGEFAARSAAGATRRNLRRSAILAVALAVVSSLGLALDWMMKVHERRVLIAEMQAIYRQSFGESAVLVDPPLQMRRALGELRRRSGETDGSDFLALLAPFTGFLGSGESLETLTFQRGTVAASVVARDPGALAAKLQAIRDKGAAGSLEIQVRAPDASGRVQITVTAQRSR